MPKETERKFLVNTAAWSKFKKPEGRLFRQAYLLNLPEKTVRVRLTPDSGFLTVKGAVHNHSRPEYEYRIPAADAAELIDQFCGSEISKIRYRPVVGGMVWDVDEFLGDNSGLILAEIELEHPDQEFEKPEWIGSEVSEDSRYYNAWLANHPYLTWKDS